MRRLTILLAMLGALLLVPVAQAFAAPSMKVNISGSGKGEVTSSGAEYPGTPPIACSYNGTSKSGVCENTPEEPELPGYANEGLEAVPAVGSTFGGWTVQKGVNESCPLESNPLECTVYNFEEGEEEFEVTAVFTKNVVTPTALTIAKTGEGSVASSPTGIECTGAKTGAECQASFEVNELVTLTASPAKGYAFSSWAGCTEHAGLTCKVKMEKAKTVKVGFVATPLLTVQKAGSGGKVSATGISCDENCSEATSAVKTGTSVTVKATPAKGFEAAIFEAGTGSASGCSGGTCTFTISENSSVKVKFEPLPTKTIKVELGGPAKYKGKVSGKGVVKGLTSAAINCGAGCVSQTETFFSTDEVTLSATASTGYTFKAWSVLGGSAGTCTGTTTPCTVKTDANKLIFAEFK